MLETFLSRAGYEVRVAANGAIGLELARAEKPDVIVSDIEMPKMSGYEFCKAVKQDPNLRSVPVILLSTLSEAEDIIKGLDAGADNYVTKPYDPKYLIARIEALRQTPLSCEDDEPLVLTVTLGGEEYRVKAGRQQSLNLLVSTFENAVEKNRELYRINSQLTIAKEKLTLWNTQLETLNQQLAHANHRMSRDLQAAARVQQSLLPEGGLQNSQVDIAWKYIPCEELAGDFLNYFMLDDQHLALFVVDVSGHGAASSLLAVAVGRLLTATASATSLLVRSDPFTGRSAITPPAAVVGELNRRFPMDAQGGLYFTISYGVLNLETRQLRLVSGGHPPVVYHPYGGQPALIESNGFPVGIVDDADYEEHSLTLQPLDRLYFYSDGVPEAMDARMEQFGDAAMLGVLEEHAESPVDLVVEKLLSAVDTWCRPHGPKDDVSILGIQVAGPA